MSELQFDICEKRQINAFFCLFALLMHFNQYKSVTYCRFNPHIG